MSDDVGANGMPSVGDGAQRYGSGVAGYGKQGNVHRFIRGFRSAANHHVQSFTGQVDFGDVAAPHPSADLVGHVRRGQAIASGFVGIDGDGQLFVPVNDVGSHVADTRIPFNGGLQLVGGDTDVFIIGARERQPQPSAPARAARVGENAGGHVLLFGERVPDLFVQVGRGAFTQHDGETGAVEGRVGGRAEASAAGAQRHLVAVHRAAGDEIVQYPLGLVHLPDQLNRRRVALQGEVDTNTLGAPLGE